MNLSKMTNNEVRRRYERIMEFIEQQVCTVHGHLTAADIEARDALVAEMQRRHFYLVIVETTGNV